MIIRYSTYNLIPEQNLIEAIGLAHDIGHPPFGHGGEVALNYAMRSNDGFEGNAQTLRICTKLGEYSDETGLNLTRRTLLGLIKYPVYYSEVVNLLAYKEDLAPLNLDSYKPPKCMFDCDKSNVDWILKPFTNDKNEFMISHDKGAKEHKKALYKSFDCSIMELADDIAYAIHDLEDSIALGLVTELQWKNEVVAKITDPLKIFSLRTEIEVLTKLLFSGENKKRKSAISKIVNHFIVSVKVKKINKFSHDLLDYQAVLDDVINEELEIFKNFVWMNVIKTPEVQTLEYKGQQMILKLFDAVLANPSRLLPKKYFDQFEIEQNNPRVICDYLAGTTDDYATRLYHKIFTPSSGSIFDKL